jgi:hypothetical protein
MVSAIFARSRVAQRNPLERSDAAPEVSRKEPIISGLSVGALFYLTSIGLVAATIIAIFFGAGFLVLPAGGALSSPGTQSGSEVGSLVYGNLPLSAGDHQPAKEATKAVRGSAGLPSAAEATANTAEDALSRRARAETLTPKTTQAARSPSAVPGQAPNTLAATLTPANPVLSAAEVTALLARGDSLLRTGDIHSARLFYERAAGAGDGRAALRLGATFDPAFLDRARLGKMQADAAVARSWYSRALDLGATDVKPP